MTTPTEILWAQGVVEKAGEAMPLQRPNLMSANEWSKRNSSLIAAALQRNAVAVNAFPALLKVLEETNRDRGWISGVNLTAVDTALAALREQMEKAGG